MKTKAELKLAVARYNQQLAKMAIIRSRILVAQSDLGVDSDTDFSMDNFSVSDNVETKEPETKSSQNKKVDEKEKEEGTSLSKEKEGDSEGTQGTALSDKIASELSSGAREKSITEMCSNAGLSKDLTTELIASDLSVANVAKMIALSGTSGVNTTKQISDSEPELDVKGLWGKTLGEKRKAKANAFARALS